MTILEIAIGFAVGMAITWLWFRVMELNQWAAKVTDHLNQGIDLERSNNRAQRLMAEELFKAQDALKRLEREAR